MMEEKYLPAGTVCMLKGGKKRVMIVGFAITPKEQPNVVYDYMGALYPEGIISNDQTMVFNHSQIETIYAKGYSDDEQVAFNQKLKEYIANPTNNLNTTNSLQPQQNQNSDLSSVIPSINTSKVSTDAVESFEMEDI